MSTASDGSAEGHPIPSVSVMIAAHNAELFVGQAILSAVSQTGVSLEVLVVDDASSDDTANVVAKLAVNDDRIDLVRSPVNKGPAGARNLALDHADGDWVAVLDSDDRFATDRLRKMCRFALEQGADIVLDDFISVDAEGRVLGAPCLSGLRPSGPVELGSWIDHNSFVRGEVSFGYSKPLIAKNFLNNAGLRYNETLRNGEDFHLILEALIAGAKVCFMAEAGYRYTRREGSVSRRARDDDLIALLEADAAIVARLDPIRQASTCRLMAVRRENLMRLRTTEAVLSAIKARRPGTTVAELVRHPGATSRVMGHLFEALRKRMGSGG